ncbi:MAG: hypothetical protein MJ147_08890 [Clostridia bacterium]|nr:hypothetical protein [Clostridia bacterium]
MPTIKVENRSDDDIIITLDGEEKELADGESVHFENKSKGDYKIRIHRKRVPRETVLASEAPQGLEALKENDAKPGSHIQLDCVLDFCVNSSKATVAVVQDIKGIETLHEDVIFAGYTAELAGAKLNSKNDFFASEKIRKTYLFQQLKGAFLPVGLAGIAVMIIGLIFSIMNMSGAKVHFLTSDVSLNRSLLLLGGGVIVTIYFIINVIKIMKRAKSLTENTLK